MADLLIGTSMSRVVFVHVFHVLDRDKGVVDCDNVDIGPVGGSPHHKAVQRQKKGNALDEMTETDVTSRDRLAMRHVTVVGRVIPPHSKHHDGTQRLSNFCHYCRPRESHAEIADGAVPRDTLEVNPPRIRHLTTFCCAMMDSPSYY